jgi:predicted Zn finger-like uncharacterized protein
MSDSSGRPDTSRTVITGDADTLRRATCPMCHTVASVTETASGTGGDWRCVRCGQRWDARRLAAVAAYVVWAAERDSPSGGPVGIS